MEEDRSKNEKQTEQELKALNNARIIKNKVETAKDCEKSFTQERGLFKRLAPNDGYTIDTSTPSMLKRKKTGMAILGPKGDLAGQAVISKLKP